MRRHRIGEPVDDEIGPAPDFAERRRRFADFLSGGEGGKRVGRDDPTRRFRQCDELTLSFGGQTFNAEKDRKPAASEDRGRSLQRIVVDC